MRHPRSRFLCLTACLRAAPLTTATPERPKTDKGWQAHLSNARAPAERIELSLGGALVVILEISGAKRFEAKVRRKGEPNPRRFRIGNFPAVSVAEARRKLGEIKSVAKEGRDSALEHRRARAGISTLRTLADLIRECSAGERIRAPPRRSRSSAIFLSACLRRCSATACQSIWSLSTSA